MTRREAILHTLGGPLVWLGLVPPHEKPARPPNNVREVTVMRSGAVWAVIWWEQGAAHVTRCESCTDALVIARRHLLADTA